jgi:hypothetical protein
MLQTMMKDTEQTAAKDSAKKMALNAEFERAFAEILALPGAMQYKFKNIPYLYQVTSPDRRLRIFSWCVPAGNGNRLSFYGYAMLRRSRWSNDVKLLKLNELQMQPSLYQHKALSTEEWPGALYTKVLQRKVNKTRYYTLLGTRLANNRYGSKIIDVATISGDTLRFGAPIFMQRNHKQYRVVFEYNPMAPMKLEWNGRKRKIVFTSMQPPYSMPLGAYEMYFPGDSYDGFTWDGECWMLEVDVKLPIDSRLEGKRVEGM